MTKQHRKTTETHRAGCLCAGALSDAANHLRAALHTATPMEGIILLELIERAAVLHRDVRRYLAAMEQQEAAA